MEIVETATANIASPPFDQRPNKREPNMKLIGILALGLVAAFPNDATACPPGSILQKGNGWEACIEQSRPIPQWKDRWGAIATDESNGAFGSSSRETSKQRAMKAAITACRKHEGKNCKVKITYFNQCASVVMGTKSHFIQSDASMEQAIARGMTRCQNEDEECGVYYSACSFQELED